MKKIFTLLFASVSAISASAQCPAGQAMVTVDVTTDAYGYECFWNVTAPGTGCTGTLIAGPFGNPTMNCASASAQLQDPSGYANDFVITETIGCVTLGSCADLNWVDDWGDGGGNFQVFVDGIAVGAPYVAAATDASLTWAVCIAAPMVNNVDMTVAAGSEYSIIPVSQIPASLLLGSAGSISSMGSGNVTGATMSVVVLNGATSVYTATSTAQNIAAGATANFTVAGYHPTTAGTYTITYTSDITETDEDLSNNVFIETFVISDSTYARDNGINTQTMGIGAGEVGYLGNNYTVLNGAMLSSVDVYISNAAGDITGNTFGVEIFAVDGTGTPTGTSIATGTGTVSATPDIWYNVDIAPNFYLAPGTYCVSLREDVAYQQQLGTSSAIVTPNTSWASWVTSPWATVESFGFNFTNMIRANINQYASVNDLTETALTVYPNPAQNELNVNGVAVGSTINVYNNVGQVVLSTVASNNFMTLDVANFVSGIYTVKTISGSNVGVAKFVKK